MPEQASLQRQAPPQQEAPLAPSHCAGGCPRCLGDTSDLTCQPGASLQGGALALAAAMYFGLPLLFALIGAAAGSRPLEQLLGAAAGLGAGIVVSAVLARRTRRREE